MVITAQIRSPISFLHSDALSLVLRPHRLTLLHPRDVIRSVWGGLSGVINQRNQSLEVAAVVFTYMGITWSTMGAAQVMDSFKKLRMPSMSFSFASSH